MQVNLRICKVGGNILQTISTYEVKTINSVGVSWADLIVAIFVLTNKCKAEDWIIDQKCVNIYTWRLFIKFGLKNLLLVAYNYFKTFSKPSTLYTHYYLQEVWNHYLVFPHIAFKQFFLMVHVPLAINAVKLHIAGQPYPGVEISFTPL